jgi:hypothetical protein
MVNSAGVDVLARSFNVLTSHSTGVAADAHGFSHYVKSRIFNTIHS